MQPHSPLVTWVLISEIFPNRVRGIAVSIATFALLTACFALAYAFPVLIEALAPVQTFLLFAAISFFYFLFLWRFIPETTAKTMYKIEADVTTHSKNTFSQPDHLPIHYFNY